MSILDLVNQVIMASDQAVLQSDAAIDTVTDGTAVTGTESVSGVPPASRRIHVTVYSGDTNDPNHETAKGIAERRRRDGISDVVFPIMRIEDIHELLQSYAYINKLQPEAQLERFAISGGYLVPDDDPGFVRHLSVLGHGSAGSDSKEAFYAFGEIAYRTSELGELRNNGLDLSRYMLDGGKLVLEGCQAGLGEAGRKFLFQIGRIFFGKKRGTLVANTGSSMGIAGEIVGGRPRELSWPKDFADFIPGVLPFGRTL